MMICFKTSYKTIRQLSSIFQQPVQIKLCIAQAVVEQRFLQQAMLPFSLDAHAGIGKNIGENGDPPVFPGSLQLYFYGLSR